MDPPPRRIARHRELRACTECRKRKLKCNRQLPCTSCARREDTQSCVYARSPNNDQQNRLQAEARLEHLKQLIQELSRSRVLPTNGSIPTSNGLPTTEDTNALQSNTNETPRASLHNGATHWSAMLDDIDELRTVVIGDHDDVEDTADDWDGWDGDDLLFGAKQSLSFHEVLSKFLPPRQKVDRLVGAYLRTRTVTASFIHSAQFRRLYQTFWDNPSFASPLWTSMLFSILDISTRFISKPHNAEVDKMARFDIAAAHCLVSGEYHRPKKFTVEALLVYAHAKCLKSADLGPEVAILVGTIVRIATVMGYHRDSDASQGRISAFEGEMRRRAWSMCIQLDMLVSFQLGLPSNIQFPTWDTRPPTNLLDSDFDEDTLQLPPARPETEPTELLFYIVKHRFATVFEKVIRHTLSASDRPLAELEAIDEENRNTYRALPAYFQARPMADSIVDPPSVVVTRLCVYFMYQKSLCVLHRKYVACGKLSSLQTCYVAGSNLVTCFLDIYKEFEPGGQLETERWFMSSLTWHTFLVACTTLCLCVCYTKQHADEHIITDVVDITASLIQLRDAKSLCEEQPSSYKDIHKVRQLIEATILKCTQPGSDIMLFPHASLYNGLIEANEADWNTMLPGQVDNWAWDESMTDSTHDSRWDFLEQFLVPQGEDFVIPTHENGSMQLADMAHDTAL